MHPSTEHVLQFFDYGHLPPHLQIISRPFFDLAMRMVDPLAMDLKGPELTVALRKLLEAKDCAVRAAIYSIPVQEAAVGPV